MFFFVFYATALGTWNNENIYSRSAGAVAVTDESFLFFFCIAAFIFSFYVTNNVSIVVRCCCQRWFLLYLCGFPGCVHFVSVVAIWYTGWLVKVLSASQAVVSDVKLYSSTIFITFTLRYVTIFCRFYFILFFW